MPNATQYGCAVACILVNKNKVLVSVPSGQGKSRIIGALIAIRSLKNYKIRHITIVFTSELLKGVDEQKY